MKGIKQADGTWLLPDGTTLQEAEYLAQLPAEEDPPNWAVGIAQAQENERLARENQELRQRLNNNNAPADPPLPTLNPGEPFQDPNKLLAAINTLIERQVAPLHEERAEYARQQQYVKLKRSIIASNPQFAAGFASIENLVDTEMEGKEPTQANLIKAIQTVIGAAYLANPAAFVQNASPNNNNNNNPSANNNRQTSDVTLPPHLATSNRSRNDSTNNNGEVVEPSDDEFDENERRLMREKGLDKMQWKVLRTIPPTKLGAKMWQAIKDKKWDVVKQLGGM